jgi:hypothetical protein
MGDAALAMERASLRLLPSGGDIDHEARINEQAAPLAPPAAALEATCARTS